MMRNFIVTDAAFTAPAPAKITVPATAAAAAYTVTWVGTAIPGVTYELQEATDSAFINLTTPQPLISAAPNFTTTKIANGTFYYRVRAIPTAASGFTTSAWRTAANPVSVKLPLTITPTTLAAASVNTPYSSTTVNTINGTSPFSWSVTGLLPSSLTFNSTTGVISGTPVSADVTGALTTYAINVTVTDSATPPVSLTAPLSLVINQVLPAAPTLLTATAFGAAQVNLAWVNNANNATGFTLQRATNATFTRALVTVATPLTLPATATTYSDLTVVAGTTYYYRIASTNGAGSSAFAVSALVKPAVLAITAPVLTAGKVNLAYTATIVATGGLPPYTWSAAGLPTSLSIAPATGIISGTLTPADVTAGLLSTVYPVTITVQDSFVPANVISTLPVNLTVNQVLPLAPTLLTATAIGMNQVNLAWVDNSNNEDGFNLQRATDKAFTLGLTAIALPANATAAASYIDTTVLPGVTYYYRVASNNAVGISKYVTTATPAKTLAVLTIPATTVLKAATVNLAYTATLAATGGLVPYTWSIDPATLPTGLTMTSAGVISGIPAPSNVTTGLPVTFPVTVTVTDSFASAPQTVTATINLVVNQALPAAPTLVTATLAGTTQINLTWVDNATNETGYTVQRATDGAFLIGLVTLTTTLPANSIAYSDTTALAGSSYYYRVASSNGLGLSKYVIATPKPIKTLAALTIPATTVLKAAKVNAAYSTTLKATGGRAPYTWSATGLPAGVTIAPATGIISAVAFPSVNPAVLSSIIPVTVTVSDAAGSTPVTMALNLTVTEVKPTVPALLAAAPGLPAQINLSWNGSANAASFTLQRSTTTAFKAATTVTIPLLTGGAYTDATVVTGTTYYYRISATNIAGVSAYSVATLPVIAP